MQKKFLMVCWSCWSWLMKLTKGVLSLAHVVNRSRCSRSFESWWDWTISWSEMLHTLLWSYMGAANTRGKCWQAVMNTMLWAQNSQFGVFDYKFFFFFLLPGYHSFSARWRKTPRIQLPGIRLRSESLITAAPLWTRTEHRLAKWMIQAQHVWHHSRKLF